VIVKPGTFLKWHRTVFGRFWRWNSSARWTARTPPGDRNGLPPLGAIADLTKAGQNTHITPSRWCQQCIMIATEFRTVLRSRPFRVCRRSAPGIDALRPKPPEVHVQASNGGERMLNRKTSLFSYAHFQTRIKNPSSIGVLRRAWCSSGCARVITS
jgi:hypothetical protein